MPYFYSIFSWGKGKMSFCFWNELRVEWFRNGIRNNKNKSWIDVASLNCICCGTITHTDYFYGVSNWCLMALVSEHQFQIPCLVLICRIEFPLRVYCKQLHFQWDQKLLSGYVNKLTCIKVIRSDGKGFLISNGDIYKGLISLWLHSITRTIFSGHILYLMKNRLKVLKSVKKCQFWSKTGFSKFRWVITP